MKLSIGIVVNENPDITLHVIDHVLLACYTNSWLIKLNIVDSVSRNGAHRRIAERYRLITDEKTLHQVKNKAQENSWLLSQVSDDSDYYLRLKPAVLVTPKSLKQIVASMEKSEDLSLTFSGGVLYRVGPGDEMEDTQ